MTELEKLVEKLLVTERNDFLVRLAKGEPNVDVQLLNRLRELATSQSRKPKPVSKQRRTVAELIKSEQEEILKEKNNHSAKLPASQNTRT